MPDISLLPEEMRKKEAEAMKKPAPPKEEKVLLHVPGEIAPSPKQGVTPAAKGEKKPGFFSRLFGGKKPAKPAAGTVAALPGVLGASPAKPQLPSPRPVAVSVPPPLPPRPTAPAPVKPVASGQLPVVPPLVPTPKPPVPVMAPKLPQPLPKPPLPASRPSASSRIHDAEPSGGGLRVSLIPTVEQASADVSRGIRVILIGTFIATAISAAGYFTTVWWVGTKQVEVASLEARLRQQTEVIKRNAGAYADGTKVNRQLKAVKALLDNHVAWTQFFTFLEKHTHQDIAFSQFATVGLDSVSLLAEARSYRAIAEQVQALTSAKEINEVIVSGIAAATAPTGEITSVHLSLTLRFDPELVRLSAATAPR